MKKAQLFGVYAGSGVYVESVAQRVTRQSAESATADVRVKVGPVPAVMPRRDALKACHAARAVGVMCWIVKRDDMAVPA